MNRDESIVAAREAKAAAKALRDAADLIDRGPAIPLHPSILSALIREQADDLANSYDPDGGDQG